MSRPKRILMVMTSHADMGVSGKKTGNWFDEVATPYYEFLAADFQVVLSSPRGGSAPIDHLSLQPPFTTANTARFLEDPAATLALKETTALSAIDYRDFDGYFFPGGYGQLWDLASDSSVLKMIEESVSEERPVAMVCHAPAILRDAKAPNGEPLVKGRSVTGFSDGEDDELDLSRHLLFSLENALIAKGANYTRSAANWEPHVVEDGALITGQNPASAAFIAKTLVARF